MIFGPIKTARPSLLLLLFLLPLFLSGCGGGASAPASDVASANQLINTALTAWKSGESASDLKAKEPKIYFAEDLLVKGMKLQDYSIDTSGEMYGTNVRFDVSLKCVSDNNQVKTHKVTYLVCTTPAQCISRQE